MGSSMNRYNCLSLIIIDAAKLNAKPIEFNRLIIKPVTHSISRITNEI